ncbi:MAG: phosphoglycerate dehydrogenase [Deltaproteobacteria bacterium RIFCSPLOWO2_12_FULL_43_16]|nr:MAG: phosphoglycerate dehydrogenase [Deltaproteobacteria bacterium GWA2_43_19]OGQ10071.1 MAG: phosphoglycerate dehydrogenase [Deltaproteobacteria bacterium RIFCSPHIGHO2_02_FULL_43_33]OGQ59054.1 MAG: phosphoglycerate dehydrogenase [Deltaproteobacteria bacterium RIFCSPLOWO2_12_FULL_43_16]HBR18459.1 phosphoglycerate dehydrogenase [Deltaproteobacteria bacterium]
MKVLISDSMSDRCVEIFKSAPGLQVDVNTKLKPEELKKVIKNYHALVVRSATKVTAEIIEAADNLKVIGRAGTGVDNIDTAAATKKGIVVMNTPGGNTITTAEHAVSMLMALARKIPQATASMRKGEWEKKKFEGTEVTGKTLGILGVGNIGSVVADRAQGLKMNVIAYDPYLSQEAANRMGVELVSLDELYKKSDFISIHVPLTNETKNLVNKDAFAKMKKGVKIINCARGGIVHEKDLCDAIKAGIVSGAAMDVFEKEPAPPDNPLLQMEEVILTPHLGASTAEAQENVAISIAEQIVDYLVKGTIRNAVNVPSVPAELLASLSPYITLAEKLGSFQGQILKGGIEEVAVEYSGDVVSYDVAPVTIAAIKGLLDQLMDQQVNFVNAPFVAKERGIKVIEIKSSRAIDFASSITIKVKTKESENLIEGALFGKKEPRIVRMDKFFLDAVPEGYLLVLHNYDKPGVIGNVGALLGTGNINIARLHLGRQAIGGEAVSVWNIDTPLPADLLAKLLKLPNMISAKVVKL